MNKLHEGLINRLTLRQRRKLNRFHTDEQGSMVIFTLFLLVLMLVVSGMAVDFMRFESRRSMMQGALDGAVLAAADLDQQLTPQAVVEDHLTKSEAGNCLTSPATVTGSANYRKVEANCAIVLDTFFLRLIGMDTLAASASATAIEGVGEIEVSMVLDISGSMRDAIPGEGTTRIARLRQAGTAFVDALLKPEFQDKVSLSLIPYSEDVNLGPALYGTLNTQSSHGYSHCVQMPPASFSGTAWNNSATYQQVAHFQWNPVYDGSGYLAPTINNPVCPDQVYERIIPISQDKTKLTNAIGQFQPRAGTSIFLGMKWAVNLLDPSFRSNINALPSGMIDSAFVGRPVDYGTSTTPSSTIKYIVLMTDGQNDYSNRLLSSSYDDPNKIAHWASMNWWYFFNGRAGGSSYRSISDYVHVDYYTPTSGDNYMQAMCTAAKAQGIIIFGVAMGSTTNGKAQMSQCASSTGHYYETSGSELVAIFEAIAKQITDLRLTL